MMMRLVKGLLLLWGSSTFCFFSDALVQPKLTTKNGKLEAPVLADFNSLVGRRGVFTSITSAAVATTFLLPPLPVSAVYTSEKASRLAEFENAVKILTSKNPNQRIDVDRQKFTIKIKLPDDIDPNIEDDIILQFTDDGKVCVREYTAPISPEVMTEDAKKVKVISKEVEKLQSDKATLEKAQAETVRQKDEKIMAITKEVEKLQGEKAALEKTQIETVRLKDDKLMAITKEVDSLKAEKVLLEKSKAEALSNIDIKVKSLNGDIDKLQSEKVVLSKTVTEKDQTIANLRTELALVKKQVGDVKVAVKDVNDVLQLIK